MRVVNTRFVLCSSLVLILVAASLNGAHSQPSPVPPVPSDVHSGVSTGIIEKTHISDLLITMEKAVKQGEVLKIRLSNVDSLETLPESARLAKQKARFFKQADGTLLALVPISVFEKPGSHTVNILDKQGKPLKTQLVEVRNGNYRTQNVRVSKSTAGLQPEAGELETVQKLKDTVSTVKFWHGSFITPTPDCQNSPFGVKRYHNGVATGDYHKGVDLRSPAGRPIRAINDGKVQIARKYRLHGGTVGLDHGQGVGSIYIHMSKINVKPGDFVKKGEVIGHVGSTGFASGPHLHWGLYVSGLPVNPNQWVKGVPGC